MSRVLSLDELEAMEFARELAAQYKAEAPARQKLTFSFSQQVKQIIQAKNINVMRFQKRTLLSKATFYRLQNEQASHSFLTVLAFCAGLDLDIYITTELLHKAGYTFNGSVEHNAYMMAITDFPGQPIEVRNEFLKHLDIKGVLPLGEDTSK